MARVVIKHLNDGAPRLRRLGDQVLLAKLLHIHDDRLLGLRQPPDRVYTLVPALFRFRLVRDAERQNRWIVGDIQDIQLLPADLWLPDNPEGIGRRLARLAVKLFELVALEYLNRSPDLNPRPYHSR